MLKELLYIYLQAMIVGITAGLVSIIFGNVLFVLFLTVCCAGLFVQIKDVLAEY